MREGSECDHEAEGVEVAALRIEPGHGVEVVRGVEGVEAQCFGQRRRFDHFRPRQVHGAGEAELHGRLTGGVRDGRPTTILASSLAERTGSPGPETVDEAIGPLVRVAGHDDGVGREGAYRS